MDELSLKSIVYRDKAFVHIMIKENNIHSDCSRANNQHPNTLTKVKQTVDSLS